MKQDLVKVKSVTHITHDVLQIVTEKPKYFNFNPGQAIDVAINKEGWEDAKRPFSFTSLPDYDYLEFIIKTYPSQKSVTNELLNLKVNDELILHDVFGAIAYKKEGLFIAGGAGITPFICIFRDLESKNIIGHNKLLFANKTIGDIILAIEFKKLLGDNFINILSEEKADGYAHGKITEDFLKKHISQTCNNVYLCGPSPMIEAIEKFLVKLHIEEKSIIKETF